MGWYEGDRSVILGGVSGNTTVDAINSVVLGGDGQTATQPNVVYIMGHKYWNYTSDEVMNLPNPEEGTMVYNTETNSFNYYSGSGWEDISGRISTLLDLTDTPSNYGNAGQVLASTGSGTEWVDQTGGGGGAPAPDEFISADQQTDFVLGSELKQGDIVSVNGLITRDYTGFGTTTLVMNYPLNQYTKLLRFATGI